MAEKMADKAKFFTTNLLSALVMAAGIASSGFFIGKSIEHSKIRERSVTVRGLSERLVKADLAELTFNFKNPGNDLKLLLEKNEKDKTIIVEFLKANGIKPEEISFEANEVHDQEAREYGYGNNVKSDFRYIIRSDIKVKTTKVDLIKELVNKSADLIKQQINITLFQRYFLTNFSKLKLEMLAESTKSAREAAEQFAKDSDSKVGTIFSANQGAFSIIGINEEYNEVTSVDKRVRVVSTVTFGLK